MFSNIKMGNQFSIYVYGFQIICDRYYILINLLVQELGKNF